MKKLLLLMAAFLTAAVANAQTTTYTGTIKDLSLNVVTFGQVTFTLTPPTDATFPGIGRFVPMTTSCHINSDGSLSGYVNGVVSGPCTVVSNTALSPAGTAYKICIQPYGQTPGSCFYDYAITASKDITTIAPTLQTGPLNYNGVPGPPGCVIGSTCTTALTPVSVNSIFYASQYAGSDVGAKINAADVAAGTGAADIWVTAAGTVSTVPTISSNHRLILAAPLTWTVSPVLNNDTQIIGMGSSATQTIHAMGAWVSASGLSNLEIDNLWVTNASTPVTEGAAMLACGPCTNVVMANNHAVKIGIFRSGTVTAYGSITTADITVNVSLRGNQVDGKETTLVGSGRFITLANLAYAQHVTMIGNDAVQAEYNVEWWGGNAAIEGLTFTNTRWASDINITGGRSVNVVSGWWGSMGQNITVTGVTADTCLDVCLDAESSTNVVFSGFTAHNSANGALAAFFGSVNNEFGPGIVTSDRAASTLMFLHNVSADPVGATGVKIHNVKFICSDRAALCVLKSDPIGSLQFNDNELINSTLTFLQTNNSGFEVSRNRFSYTFAPAAFNAVTIPGQVCNYKPTSAIAGNTFESTVPQPAGTFAINATITDFNFGGILFVRDNTTQGFVNDAKFVANSGNAGISPTFVFMNNSWGANSVTKSITGTLGRFIGSNHDPTADAFNFTGLSVTGVLKVGVTGSPINTVLTGSATLTFTSIAASSQQVQTITITGAAVANKGVNCAPQAALGGGVLMWNSFVLSANTVSVQVTNVGTSAVTPSAVTWGCSVIQ